MIKKIQHLYYRYFTTPEKYARYLGVNIGDNCDIKTRYYGSEPYLIKIGNHVQITNDVRFFTHGGVWVFRQEYPLMDVFGKIIIGDNVYIGNCALLLPGITIGDNVIIGAGSVVTKSINSGDIVGGNPAKVIGKVKDLEKKMIKNQVETKKMNSISKKKFLTSLDSDKFLTK
ncbi:acyltransferase [Galbibacter sp. BG1]